MSSDRTNDYGQYAEGEAREQAAEDGYQVRVVSRDGNPYVVTRDYRLDRINLEIDHNRVSKAYLG